MKFDTTKPQEIEKRSFEIIEAELPYALDPQLAPIIKRVVHTTADFDYVENMYFSENAVERAHDALRAGTQIITDTNMAKAGINKRALAKLGGAVDCFMSDEDVAEKAGLNGTTRAVASIDKAASFEKPLIVVVGNAPTALIRLYELIEEKRICPPALIIGTPVGFVNVVQSKELIMQTDIPCIIARGRKGGSNVAASIVNALMYQIVER